MSSHRPELLVAPCSYQAAKYAVEKWHYSRVMPAGKTVKWGVWENESFIGAVVFSFGANNHIGSPYGLAQIEVCELVRIALRGHITPTSRIVTAAMNCQRRQSPGLRLMVSYADPEQGHIGAIYQAMNWLYVGHSQPQRETLRPDGRIMHKRTAHSLYGTIRGLERSRVLWKYKYLYPLDRAMRRQIAPLAQPYPKKDVRPVKGDDLATSEAGRFDSEPGALGDD